METKKTKISKALLRYSLWFLILAGLTFSVFAICNKIFMSDSDGYLQHYPLLVRLRQMMKGLIHGEGFPLWKDEIGYGNDWIGNFSVIMMDPFSYIAAAFPIPYIDIGYSVACVLRMYTAGAAMLLFLRYHHYSEEKVVIGALSYALSYWAVGAINHGFFMLPLILFPLIILGIDKVWNGESHILLICSVAASFITYVYFAYMTGIGCFIYVTAKYWMGNSQEKKSLPDFLYRLVSLAVDVVLAACLSAPVLVTMIYTLLRASKTTGLTESLWPQIREFLHYLPALVGDYEISGHYSYIGTNALLAAVIPFMFTRGWKKNKLPIFLFLLFFVLMEVPLWGRFMNAFSYRMGRWCYIPTFFFVYAAVDNLDALWHRDKRENRLLWTWVLILAGWCLAGKLFSQSLTPALMTDCLWNLFCLLFFVMAGSDRRRRMALLAVNICVSYWLIFSPFGGDRVSNYMDRGYIYKIYSKSVLRAYPELESGAQDFFRVDFNEHSMKNGTYLYACTPSNENLYWDARTLTGYLSTINQDMFLWNIGLENAGASYRRMCAYSLDNRTRLGYLMGVRYYLCGAEEENVSSGEKYAGYAYQKSAVQKDVQILASSHETSLGYFFDKAVLRDDYETMPALEKEQTLMQAVVLEEPSEAGIQNVQPSDISTEYSTLSWTASEATDIDPSEGRFDITGGARTMSLDIPDAEGSEIYLRFRNLQKTPLSIKESRELEIGKDKKSSRYSKIKYNMNHLSEIRYGNFEYHAWMGAVNKRVIYADGDPQGITDYHDFMSNLGLYEQGSGTITVSFSDSGHYTFDAIEVYAVPVATYDEQASVLEDHRYMISDYREDHIRGTVQADQPGMLFVSLLYNPGWEAWVDGEKTEIRKADVCFMGIPLTAGEHEVVLRFRPMGWTASWCLTAAAVLLMAAQEWLRRRSAEKKGSAA